jgi:hypothetical protein
MTERLTGDGDLEQLAGPGWLGTRLLSFSVSPGQALGPVAAGAVAATLALHAALEAVYPSPGHGRRRAPSPFSSAQAAPVRTGRKQ